MLSKAQPLHTVLDFISAPTHMIFPPYMLAALALLLAHS